MAKNSTFRYTFLFVFWKEKYGTDWNILLQIVNLTWNETEIFEIFNAWLWVCFCLYV